MKIQILSDLHNEFYSYHSLPPIEQTDADIIILAGDIDKGTKGIQWAIMESQRLDKPIIYIAGNHEYYDHEYFSTLHAMRKTSKNTKVHFLECNEYIIKNTRILGCTLWSDFSAFGNTTIAMQEAKHKINDYQYIAIANSNNNGTSTVLTQHLKPSDTLQFHTESVMWLQEKLAYPFSGHTVVVTHYGPHKLCQHPNYPLSHISGSFYSELNKLMNKADLWIYGHTHACLDSMVQNTRLISNQRGYKDIETVAEFNSTYVITL